MSYKTLLFLVALFGMEAMAQNYEDVDLIQQNDETNSVADQENASQNDITVSQQPEEAAEGSIEVPHEKEVAERAAAFFGRRKVGNRRRFKKRCRGLRCRRPNKRCRGIRCRRPNSGSNGGLNGVLGNALGVLDTGAQLVDAGLAIHDMVNGANGGQNAGQDYNQQYAYYGE